MKATSTHQPWYKNTMVWLAFSPAIVGVVVGLSLLTVGTINFDGTVHEDYYKKGRIIEQTFDQDRLAREKNLSAEIEIESSRLTLNLSGDLEQFPDQLEVLMENPTRSALDFSVPVQHLGQGKYLGNLPRKIEHEWDVKVYGANKEWRLYGRDLFPLNGSLVLNPSQR